MDKSKHTIQELHEKSKKYHNALKRIIIMINSGNLGIHRGKRDLYEILDEVGVHPIF